MPDLVLDATPADETDRLYQAEALVRSYCGWHIAPSRVETFTLDGSGSPLMVLPTLRLTAVTSVTNDGVVVDPATLEWSEAGALRLPCWGYWTWKYRGVVVEATHGYDKAPFDLAGAVQAIASRASNNPGLASQTRGPFSESYVQTFLEPERMVLDRYKLPPRP